MASAVKKSDLRQRRSQRQILTCTECARRKQRCSKTVPCTSCVDRGIADACCREESGPARGLPGSSLEPRLTTAETTQFPRVVPGAAIPTETDPRNQVQSASLHHNTRQSSAASLDGSSEHFTSLSASEANVGSADGQAAACDRADGSGIMNETVVTLEFLTHGRQNILNSKSNYELSDDLSDASENGYQPSSEGPIAWDTILSPEEVRSLLLFHQENLAWMHNVVHMPSFISEFEMSLTRPANACWRALYYAILSTTFYHASEAQLAELGIECTETLQAGKVLHDKSIQCLYEGKFTSKHNIFSAQAICVLLQISHNIDQSDMISVLLAAAIKICQCLNMHRLGADREDLTLQMTSDAASRYLIKREVKKRVWWFLIRQDWLQIPFQNTYLVHASQFNSPMPINCFDEPELMVRDGKVVSQPDDVYTQNSYSSPINHIAVIMWKHQDRMCQVGHPSKSPDNILKLYDQVIWADQGLKRVLRELPDFLNPLSSHTNDLLPPLIKQQAHVGLLSMAHKVLSVHRHFQLESFRDRRFAFTQLSCLSIAEQSILNVKSWTDSPSANITRRMWTVITHLTTCCVILIFASIFRDENALLYDGDKMRCLAEAGRRCIGLAISASSIARRSARMLDALLDLDKKVRCSSDIRYFNVEDIIQRVTSDTEGQSAIVTELTSYALPWDITSWDNMFGGDESCMTFS